MSAAKSARITREWAWDIESACLVRGQAVPGRRDNESGERGQGEFTGVFEFQDASLRRTEFCFVPHWRRHNRTEKSSVLRKGEPLTPSWRLSAIVSHGLQAGWTAAGCESSGRKVRAPQDRVTDNIGRPQGPGKCNRKQTAARHLEPPSACRAVRVKRCGKSAPAAG